MNDNVRAALLGCFACALAFVFLAALSHASAAAQHFDAALLARLSEPGSRSGSVAAAIARLGDPAALLAMLALACGVALARHRPRRALAALALVAGANLTTQLFKALLAHPRFQSAVGVEQLASNSFPSGHTTAVASIAIAFLFVVPATGERRRRSAGPSSWPRSAARRWRCPGTTRATSSAGSWSPPDGGLRSSPACGRARAGNAVGPVSWTGAPPSR